jgi:hypothetical protein
MNLSESLTKLFNTALATHLEGTTELEKVESLYLKALLIDPRSVDTMLNFATLYRQHSKYIMTNQYTIFRGGSNLLHFREIRESYHSLAALRVARSQQHSRAQ